MQSGGAEMLRLAAWRMVEAGLIPSMLIHDGILIEARSQEDVDLAIEIMREADGRTCDGLESVSMSIRARGWFVAKGSATSGRWRRRCGGNHWRP